MTRKTALLILIFTAVIGIQFIDAERTNPPVHSDIDAPAEIKTIIRTSCYDCHSNETAWPWYSKIAPFSWIVSNDVSEGREHLNFSDWEKLYTDKQRRLAEEIIEEIDGNSMPPTLYTVLHPSANLSIDSKAKIKSWFKERVH